MNRAAVASSFAVAAFAVLAIQIVNHFGYDTVKGILLLLVTAAVVVVSAGVDSAVALAVALLAFYAISEVLGGDRLTAAVILGALAVVAALAAGGRRFFR